LYDVKQRNPPLKKKPRDYDARPARLAPSWIPKPERVDSASKVRTEFVDNFVQNWLDMSLYQATTRDCDRSMTKKADKNPMNSNTYDEKSCSRTFFIQHLGLLSVCGVMLVRNPC
jgi:hypothetical protein